MLRLDCFTYIERALRARGEEDCNTGQLVPNYNCYIFYNLYSIIINYVMWLFIIPFRKNNLEESMSNHLHFNTAFCVVIEALEKLCTDYKLWFTKVPTTTNYFLPRKISNKSCYK